MVIQFRRSSPADVDLIANLIEPHVVAEKLLPRSREEIAKLAEYGYLASDNERISTETASTPRIIGFCAVEIYSRKLAELQCLAVDSAYQGRGVGSQLVKLCVEIAAENGVLELMAITASEKLFQDVGFDYSLPDQKRALFIHPQRRD